MLLCMGDTSKLSGEKGTQMVSSSLWCSNRGIQHILFLTHAEFHSVGGRHSCRHGQKRPSRPLWDKARPRGLHRDEGAVRTRSPVPLHPPPGESAWRAEAFCPRTVRGRGEASDFQDTTHACH